MNIIVAYCKNRGIGLANRLPWRLRKDMEHFKNLTIGDGNNAVIMGRKTWESLPDRFKPLPKRVNIILSRTMDPHHSDRVHIFPDIISAKQFCEQHDYSQVWILGGQKIYEQFIGDNDVQNIFVTHIDKHFPCDAFFPPFKKRFKLKWQSDLQMDDTILFRFKQYSLQEKKKL